MKSIGTLKPPSLPTAKGFVGDRFLVQDNKMNVGEVYTAGIQEELRSKTLAGFFRALTSNGYTTRNSQWYDSLSLTYCKGSVQLHTDPQFGLAALWLVSVKALHKDQQSFEPDRPSFYSSKQWLDVRLGEIIIFDANKEHAWLSNYHCSMIMQTVRRVRRTGRVESN